MAFLSHPLGRAVGQQQETLDKHQQATGIELLLHDICALVALNNGNVCVECKKRNMGFLFQQKKNVGS